MGNDKLKKSFKIALVVVFLLMMITILIFLVLLIMHRLEYNKCKKVITDYIDTNYGNNYTIIREEILRSGDSGRQSDLLVVQQDGVQYYIYSDSEKVIEDHHNAAFAGKEMADRLDTFLEYLKSIDKTEYTLTIEDSRNNSPYLYPEEVVGTDYLDIFLSIKQDSDDADIEALLNNGALYDFYVSACEEKPYSIYIQISPKDNGNESLKYFYSFSDSNFNVGDIDDDHKIVDEERFNEILSTKKN